VSLVFESGSGTITVPDSALLQIAVRAAESVDGVRVRRKRTVDVEGKVVRLEVSVHGNEPLVAAGEAVQRAVGSALATMCGLDVAVDVAIEELA
jgi:uncharacterized alkaline shock family protein YloU